MAQSLAQLQVQQFEKKIAKLDQEEILSYSVSVINKLLIENGLTTIEDLQKRFLKKMKARKLSKKRV